MRPDTFNFGNACGFELVPHRTAAISAAIKRIVIRRHGRNCAQQHRIVAVHKSFDPDRRFRVHVAGIVARPFPERSFIDHVVRINEPLEGNLGVGRDRQAGFRHVYDFNTLADQPAGAVVFILTVGHFQSGDHEQRRMHPGNNGNRARLATLEILVLDNVAMFALGHHDRGRLGVMRLHPIGTVIDPARIRVFHHHHAGGADKIAAIEFVPFRRRDFHDVNIVALEHVFDQRPAIDLNRRVGRLVFHVFAPVIDQLDLGRVDRLAERDIDARHRGQDIRQHARALRKSGDIVEHHRRVGHLVHVNVDNRANLFMVIGARHML